MPHRILRRRPARRVLKRRDNGIGKQSILFTRKIRKAMWDALNAGFTIIRSCELVGISYETHNAWMNAGKDPDRPVHRYYRRKVKAASGRLEKENLDIIRLAAQGGEVVKERKITTGPNGVERVRIRKVRPKIWQAGAWILERRFREEYGREALLQAMESPVEKARQIKDALDAMMGSVPTSPEQEPQMPEG